MGGIVGAETINLLSSEQPLPPRDSMSNSASAPNFPSNTTQASATSTSHPTPQDPEATTEAAKDEPASSSTFMFPHIVALLAFDTPFLGISPGVIAHGAESHYKTASQAYKTFSEVSSIFGWGSPGTKSPNTGSVAGMLPAPDADAAAAPSWQSWGKYAMFAGAAGAVAAGASAAIYTQKDKISLGWGWVTSHLEFVGCLARGQDLKQRVQDMTYVSKERQIGFVDFYTVLGKSAREGYGASQTVLGDRRTFCSLPKRVLESGKNSTGDPETSALHWYPAINDKAKDEVGAHMSMFFPRENPNFYTLGQSAKEWIIHRILEISPKEKLWYEESEELAPGSKDAGITHGEVGDDGWEKPDYEAADVKVKMEEKNHGVEEGNRQLARLDKEGNITNDDKEGEEDLHEVDDDDATWELEEEGHPDNFDENQEDLNAIETLPDGSVRPKRQRTHSPHHPTTTTTSDPISTTSSSSSSAAAAISKTKTKTKTKKKTRNNYDDDDDDDGDEPDMIKMREDIPNEGIGEGGGGGGNGESLENSIIVDRA